MHWCDTICIELEFRIKADGKYSDLDFSAVNNWKLSLIWLWLIKLINLFKGGA